MLSETITYLRNNLSRMDYPRYRPKNPDKKPLVEPEIRHLNAREQKQLTAHEEEPCTEH